MHACESSDDRKSLPKSLKNGPETPIFRDSLSVTGRPTLEDESLHDQRKFFPVILCKLGDGNRRFLCRFISRIASYSIAIFQIISSQKEVDIA